MRDLTQQTSADGPAGDNGEVEKAVDAILRKLKRGRAVRLPGIGSLLPGAPPQFKPVAGTQPARAAGKEKTGNAKP